MLVNVFCLDLNFEHRFQSIDALFLKITSYINPGGSPGRLRYRKLHAYLLDDTIGRERHDYSSISVATPFENGWL